MDPNEALRMLRELMAALAKAEPVPDDVGGLIDQTVGQFKALDEWLTKGGFPPNDWKKEG